MYVELQSVGGHLWLKNTAGIIIQTRSEFLFKRLTTIFVAVSFFSQSLGVSPASADTPIFLSNSVEDRKQPANMNYRYELFGVSVTVMKENPGEIIIKAHFASSVSAQTFMSYGNSTPVLQIKILNRLTDYKNQGGDVWLQAPDSQPYSGSTRINAIASGFRDQKVGVAGGRVDLADCKPKTWMDDGATSNWVAFSIDRNCADINNTFWTTAFVDSDKFASSFIFDSKWAPAEPMYVDMNALPRPPKMLNQIVSFSTNPGLQNLEFPNFSTSASSSMGLPLSFASLTPTICQVIPSGNSANIRALIAGTCRIETWAEGNATVNPSPRVQQSITINPIVMVSQRFSYYEPSDVVEGDPEFELDISTSSNLPIVLQSQDGTVCYFKDPINRPRLVSIMGAGTCYFTVSQAGSSKYYSASGTATFEVAAKYVAPPEDKKTQTDKGSSGSTSKPVEKTFGGSSSTSGGSTSVNTQAQSDALAKQGKEKKTIKCRNIKNPKKILKETAVKPVCPKGYKQYS